MNRPSQHMLCVHKPQLLRGWGGGQGTEPNPTLTAYQPNALPLGQSGSLLDAWTDVELILGRTRSKHCFPAPSSKPCQNGFSHWMGYSVSKQLSADAISAVQKVWVLVRLWKRHSIHAHEHEEHLPWVEKVISIDHGFIYAGVNAVGSYKRKAWYNLSCLLQT